MSGDSDDLDLIDVEIDSIETEIARLERKRNSLKERKKRILSQREAEKEKSLNNRDWTGTF